MEENVPRPHFYQLSAAHEKLKFPLSRFALFRKFMAEEYEKKMDKIGWSTNSPKLGREFITSEFYRTTMDPFIKDFYLWLKELARNNRGFKPFELDEGVELTAFIKKRENMQKKKVAYDGGLLSGKGFNEYLNFFAQNEYVKPEQKIVDMFYRATNKIIEEKYNL
jgi:hypothetical protein